MPRFKFGGAAPAAAGASVPPRPPAIAYAPTALPPKLPPRGTNPLKSLGIALGVILLAMGIFYFAVYLPATENIHKTLAEVGPQTDKIRALEAESDAIEADRRTRNDLAFRADLGHSEDFNDYVTNSRRFTKQEAIQADPYISEWIAKYPQLRRHLISGDDVSETFLHEVPTGALTATESAYVVHFSNAIEALDNRPER